MLESTEEKFKKLLEKQKLEHLDQSAAYYVAKYHDPSLPKGQSFIYQKFKTKAERDKWYRETGGEIEKKWGGWMEMPDETVSEEEIKKLKSGQ